jgi:hypothetical protein
VCFRRSFKVSSSPSPTTAQCINAFKKHSHAYFSPLELSLLSWNLGGDLDASGWI